MRLFDSSIIDSLLKKLSGLNTSETTIPERDPSSSEPYYHPRDRFQRALFPQKKRELTQEDIGKRFVRVMPHIYPHGRYDYHAIPLCVQEEKILRDSQTLLSLDSDGTMYTEERYIGTMKHKPDWNDGYWMPAEEYVALTRGLKEKDPLPKDPLPKDFLSTDISENGWICCRPRCHCGTIQPSRISFSSFSTLHAARPSSSLRSRAKASFPTDRGALPSIAGLFGNGINTLWFVKARVSGKEKKVRCVNALEKKGVLDEEALSIALNHLGLPPHTKDLVVVTKQYRKLSLLYHPDRKGDVRSLTRVQKAYQCVQEQLAPFKVIFPKDVEGQIFVDEMGKALKDIFFNEKNGKLSVKEVLLYLEQMCQHVSDFLSRENLSSVLRLQEELREHRLIYEIMTTLSSEALDYTNCSNPEESITLLIKAVTNLEALCKEHDLLNEKETWKAPLDIKTHLVYFHFAFAYQRALAEAYAVQGDESKAMETKEYVKEVLIPKHRDSLPRKPASSPPASPPPSSQSTDETPSVDGTMAECSSSSSETVCKAVDYLRIPEKGGSFGKDQLIEGLFENLRFFD